jgi:hypothetical protein
VWTTFISFTNSMYQLLETAGTICIISFNLRGSTSLSLLDMPRHASKHLTQEMVVEFGGLRSLYYSVRLSAHASRENHVSSLSPFAFTISAISLRQPTSISKQRCWSEMASKLMVLASIVVAAGAMSELRSWRIRFGRTGCRYSSPTERDTGLGHRHPIDSTIYIGTYTSSDSQGGHDQHQIKTMDAAITHFQPSPSLY